MHAGQVLTGKAALHIGIGAETEEHRIVFVHELRERQVHADVGIQHKLDAHLFHQRASGTDDFLFELERRNAKGQQPADLRIAVVNDRLHPIACEDVGTSQTSRAGADDSDALTGVRDVR